MKRALIPVVLSLVSLAAGTAQAGWWHHHHRQPVYAAPAYYMPAYAPQVVQSQSGIADALLLELFRRLPGSGTNPGPSTPPTSANSDVLASIQADLRELKSGLKGLDERVENVNSTVQAQGEAFGLIMAELKAIREKPPAVSEELKKVLEDVSTKLKPKTIEELKALLDSNPALKTELNKMFVGADDAAKAVSRDKVLAEVLKLLNK